MNLKGSWATQPSLVRGANPRDLALFKYHHIGYRCNIQMLEGLDIQTIALMVPVKPHPPVALPPHSYSMGLIVTTHSMAYPYTSPVILRDNLSTLGL